MTVFATTLLALLALPAATTASSTASTSEAPVLLDFHASWCGPCQQMRSAIKRLVADGYPVKSVDVDRSQGLAARYGIREVPTFVVIDSAGRELARTSGLQPASELAALYGKAKTKLARAAEPAEDEPEPATAADEESDEPKRPQVARRGPDPWKTVVRIRIRGAHAEGVGSGTIVYSTPEEAIILTCAHIFHVDGVSQQYHPSRFPLAIAIDLFDGELHGLRPAMVHPVETVAGKAIDYDFGLDVGLIRIRPGRKLSSSPVVPAGWSPREGMPMTTVGCSEGHNATAWSTRVTNRSVRGLVGNNRYEATECAYAPKQGRSGGGLYTLDGYLAGVCDFAEPRGAHGLYASPRSIQKILDKNALTICYNPSSAPPEVLLASRGRGAAAAPKTKLRAQNSELPRGEVKRITMPAPELIGAAVPSEGSAPAGPSRAGWRSPTRVVSARQGANLGRPVETEIQMEPSARDEPLPDSPRREEPVVAPPSTTKSKGWKAVRVDP
jgi:thiol-disulfide isomerase/thioredoxin